MGCTFSPGNGRYLIRGTGIWTEGGSTFRTTIGGAFVEVQLFIIRAPAEFCLPVKKKLFSPGFQVMVYLRSLSDRPVTVAGRVHAYPLPAYERQEIMRQLPERLRALAVDGSRPRFGEKETWFESSPKHEYTTPFGDIDLPAGADACVELPFPTLKFKKPSNMQPVTLVFAMAFGDAQDVVAVMLKPPTICVCRAQQRIKAAVQLGYSDQVFDRINALGGVQFDTVAAHAAQQQQVQPPNHAIDDLQEAELQPEELLDPLQVPQPGYVWQDGLDPGETPEPLQQVPPPDHVFFGLPEGADLNGPGEPPEPLHQVPQPGYVLVDLPEGQDLIGLEEPPEPLHQVPPPGYVLVDLQEGQAEPGPGAFAGDQAFDEALTNVMQEFRNRDRDDDPGVEGRYNMWPQAAPGPRRGRSPGARFGARDRSPAARDRHDPAPRWPAMRFGDVEPEPPAQRAVRPLDGRAPPAHGTGAQVGGAKAGEPAPALALQQEQEVDLRLPGEGADATGSFDHVRRPDWWPDLPDLSHGDHPGPGLMDTQERGRFLTEGDQHSFELC